MAEDSHSKKIIWQIFPVHAVTSDTLVTSPDFLERATEVASSKKTAINLRAHSLGGRRLLETAKKLREITSAAGTPLIVGGRIDVAIAAGADVVQLGTHTVPLEAAAELCGKHGIKFGYSCHSVQEAVAAEKAGASYVYLGTVFSSASKPGVAPCGVDLLAKTCESVNIPVVAIGGVDPTNVGRVAGATASGAAAISSIWNAPDPKAAALELAAFF
jgi:thiamine-phosphate pyrophosphorylase